MLRFRSRTRAPLAGRAGRVIPAKLLLDENLSERLVASLKVLWLNIGNATNASTVALLLAQVATIDAFAGQSEATFLALGFG